MIFTLNIFFMSVNNNKLLYLTTFLTQFATVGRNYFSYSNDKITFPRDYQDTSCWSSPAGHSLVQNNSFLLKLKNQLMRQKETEFLQLPSNFYHNFSRRSISLVRSLMSADSILQPQVKRSHFTCMVFRKQYVSILSFPEYLLLNKTK